MQNIPQLKQDIHLYLALLRTFLFAAMWLIGARNFPHSRQNTTSSQESYHGVVLKRLLSFSRTTATNWSIQWLLNELMNVVLAHYVHKVRIY